MRKLSEKMEGFRSDRPSEWMMGEYISDAIALESRIAELEDREQKALEANSYLSGELATLQAENEALKARLIDLEHRFALVAELADIEPLEQEQ